MMTPALALGPVITADREDRGEYTLGNEGVVTEVGLDPPVSATEFSGESGRDRPERDGPSVMRESEYVRSNDWARFVSERGFVSESLSFDSNNESEPRFSESSA